MGFVVPIAPDTPLGWSGFSLPSHNDDGPIQDGRVTTLSLGFESIRIRLQRPPRGG